MPHVASKASVLKPQHTGLTQRERMGEPKDSSSPFSILLAEPGGEPPRSNAKKTQGIVAPQRTDAPRHASQRNDAERPQETDQHAAADAPDACATETAATEQPDDAATSFEIAVAGQAAVTVEASPPAESNGDATNDEIAAIDAALATVVETPAAAVPAQPVELGAPPLAVAVTPAAAAPTDPGTVESTAAAGVTTAAPTGNSAPVTPDIPVDTAEPPLAQAPQQAPEVPPAQPGPQVPEQAAQAPAAPAVPVAKPRVEQTTTAETAATESSPSPSATETPEAVTPAASASNQEPTNDRPAPKHPAHADAPPQHAARPHGADAAERPQNASAVSDFVQAAQQQTPDGSQFAQLQAGRDFGQAVAAAAHAAQGAPAAHPLMSAPVPLEGLAVEIATRAQGGSNRFEISLDPPELGRIDVRLDIDRSGNVTSRLVVEKAETLDVLRRDAHQLERALQDAGLKTSDNGLQFSLRDQSSAGRDDRNNANNPQLLVADPELVAPEGATAVYGLALRGGSGIDIRV